MNKKVEAVARTHYFPAVVPPHPRHSMILGNWGGQERTDNNNEAPGKEYQEKYIEALQWDSLGWRARIDPPSCIRSN